MFKHSLYFWEKLTSFYITCIKNYINAFISDQVKYLANITKHILQISLTNRYLCNMLTADNAYIADICNTDKIFSFWQQF